MKAAAAAEPESVPEPAATEERRRPGGDPGAGATPEATEPDPVYEPEATPDEDAK